MDESFVGRAADTVSKVLDSGHILVKSAAHFEYSKYLTGMVANAIFMHAHFKESKKGSTKISLGDGDKFANLCNVCVEIKSFQKIYSNRFDACNLVGPNFHPVSYRPSNVMIQLLSLVRTRLNGISDTLSIRSGLLSI